MTDEARDYLALAKQADEAADKAQSIIAERAWRSTAEQYRKLAAEKLKLHKN
jgi:hypothetical protein